MRLDRRELVPLTRRRSTRMTPDRFRPIPKHGLFRHRLIARQPATLTEHRLLYLPRHRNIPILHRPIPELGQRDT